MTFVVGVATGIVMEFEFGTNWAAYSRFVGDIFGAPLAAEGVFAFFLESGFLGLLLFGRKRISSFVRWFASLMVALGTTLSAFWIIVANSWMQTPAGFRLANGRAELTDFCGRGLQPLDAAALRAHHRGVPGPWGPSSWPASPPGTSSRAAARTWRGSR